MGYFFNFITKADTNGNIYRLQVNHETKKIYYNFSCGLFTRSDAVLVSKKDLQRLRADYKNVGYMEV